MNCGFFSKDEKKGVRRKLFAKKVVFLHSEIVEKQHSISQENR